jgi:hypothetical protein
MARKKRARASSANTGLKQYTNNHYNNPTVFLEIHYTKA